MCLHFQSFCNEPYCSKNKRPVLPSSHSMLNSCIQKSRHIPVWVTLAHLAKLLAWPESPNRICITCQDLVVLFQAKPWSHTRPYCSLLAHSVYCASGGIFSAGRGRPWMSALAFRGLSHGDCMQKLRRDWSSADLFFMREMSRWSAVPGEMDSDSLSQVRSLVLRPMPVIKKTETIF